MTPSFSLLSMITSISVVDIERSTTNIFGRSTIYRKVEGLFALSSLCCKK